MDVWRKSCIEQCEPRNLFAVAPQLIAIFPNTGDALVDGQIRDQAAREFVFQFDEGQRIDQASAQSGGIQFVRAGGDGIIGNGNDVSITPDVAAKNGWIGIGDRSNEVVVRFTDDLIDDKYQVRIVGSGTSPLRNFEQLAFNNGADRIVQFELDLGPGIVAVVPQPIERSNNVLTQARNQIDVYFNDDDLSPQSAVNPAFYQLIRTRKTADVLDDGAPIHPRSVVYDAAANKARLIFADDLALLDATESTYRLRVGNRYSQPQAPIVRTLLDTGEPADTFADAVDLNEQIGGGSIGAQTVIVQGTITQVAPFPLDLPGGNDEPGHRDLPGGVDSPHLGGADGGAGISQFFYNFRDDYGFDPRGNPLSNLITPAQKQRAREVFAYYSRYLGVQFVETANQGWIIATGDLRAVDPTAVTGPGGIAGIAGGSIAVMDSAENWGSSEIGGSWFGVAMHEVGHLLGLGHTYDLPPLTIQGSDPTQGGGDDPAYPGDHDIVHGRHLHRPESTDIDLFRFTIDQTGVFSAETVAERLPDSSLLDTVIWVYNAAGTLVARNDDYFSEDSFIELELQPGEYFVGITSTGMAEINPRIAESGFGGTSEGDYELRINFKASSEQNPTVASGIVDSDGRPTLLDGNSDGKPGGEYNFWFTVAPAANTFYVDKAGTSGGNGSLGAPFNNIGAALTATAARNSDANTANDIQVVRLVGNGGADGNLSTQNDNLAYEIGFNSLGQPLSDGATMQVPRGVTVMVDAGALFRLRRANIDVGSKAQGVDHSLGHLQVLGTPNNQVVFTSYNSRPGQTETPLPGDWGGIVFRNELDNDARRERVLEHEGIFVNYINHGDFSYGGGVVVVNGLQSSFSPIHLNEARPGLSFNRISNSASGAISADPNSFAEDLYPGDYRRVGPDIHDNNLSNNTINGLFIQIDTLAGQILDRLEVNARFDDADIAHVMTESLIIAGTPAGPVIRQGGTRREARLDARLAIDPGIVVKLDHARIETEIGAEFIAEGLLNNRVVFTSLLDTRYGGLGTFATARVDQVPFSQGTVNVVAGIATLVGGAIWPAWAADATLTINGTPYAVISRDSDIQLTLATTLNVLGATFSLTETTEPAAGDWAGLVFGPLSHGSLDHALITFGGGTAAVEGSFATFNPVEIQQADVRLVDSVLERNAGGRDVGRGLGRFANDGAVIFVRGAQPVILDNIIRDNDASDETSAISINVNALNSEAVHDLGRSRNAIEQKSQHVGNRGPLIRNNKLSRNSVNGMEVRGSTLTTQSVWDDVDIVHVLFDEVLVQNHHTFSGLRLQSSGTQSLVIKLLGAGAGVTASGVPLDIDDRIGGSVYVLGTPGHPVVMTSLFDNSIGAGFDAEGRPQNDTGNTGRLEGGSSLPTGPEVNAGNRIDNDVDPSIVGHFEMTVGRGGDSRDGTFTAQGNFFPITGDFIFDYLGYVDVGSNGGAVQLGFTTITQQPRLIAPDVVESRGNFRGQNGTINWIATTRIGNGQTRMETAVSFNSPQPIGNLRYISYLDQDVAFGNDVLALSGAPGDPSFLATSLSDAQRVGFGHGGVYFPGTGLQGATWDGWAADVAADLKRAITTTGTTYSVTGNIDVGPGAQQLPQLNDPSLGTIWGPRDVSTAFAWSLDSQANTSTVTTFLDFQFKPPSPAAKGDWRSVRFESYSNDRNVAVVTEREQGDTNGDPGSAQSVGQLASTPQIAGADPSLMGPGERGGDDNRRLGFEVHGQIATPGDVDVYTFKGRGGQEVWLDIDRTTHSLDTVIELIDASGAIVARSNDSEALDQASAVGARVFPLQRDSFGGRDLYTTNPRDAGMQVILPGPVNSLNDYYVRIRSNVSAADSLDDPSKLNQGETLGVYQLQVRLRNLDEVPGSTVLGADIRYATNGIELLGVPTHSPLLGEAFETTLNNDVGLSSQFLGNLLKQERGALSVGGSLSDYNDVDWYAIDIDWQNFQDIPNPEGDFDNTASVIFDFDYADGASRPDTNFAIFDDTGTLIYLARNSNITDDQPSTAGASDKADLSRGSFGEFDPYLGPVHLRENDGKRYFLAVSSDSNLPEVLNSPSVRIEPLLAQDRLFDDRVGSSWVPAIANRPTPKRLFPVTATKSLNSYADPWHLGDVTLFVHNGSRLWSVDPFTGRLDSDIGAHPNVSDLVMRTDGRLLAMETDGDSLELSAADASTTAIGDDAIANNPSYRAFTVYDQGTNRIAVAMDTQDNVYLFNAETGTTDEPVTGWDNDPAVAVSGIQGTVTGLARIGSLVYGVTDVGQMFSLVIPAAPPTAAIAATVIQPAIRMPDPANPAMTISIPFSGLARGPQNVENAAYANRLFATDNLGNLHALERTGTLAPIFAGGKTTVATGLPGLGGLAFSTLDYNLWHVTERREADAGHGLQPTPDGEVSRLEPIEGGVSFWFGLEQDSTQPGVNAYQSNAGLYNTYDLPGGAHGTLTTDIFSLGGYAFGDAPTFYFNYLAQHDDVLDSFRIHISNDGADWSLLDQTPVPAVLQDRNEFDANLVNDGQWRQARLDLSPFAGLETLRIRFDFNTLGGRDLGLTNYTGTPLSAIPGADLADGQSFSLLNPLATTPTVFEFDMGFGLRVPFGAAVAMQEGETLTITRGAEVRTFEFDTAGDGVATGRVPIVVASTDTGETVAAAIETVISGAGITGLTVRRSGQRLSLVGATDVQQVGTTVVIEGSVGASAGTIPIAIHAAMTSQEVALAIARSLDAHYAITVNMKTDDPLLFTASKVDGDTIYVAGPRVFDPGPLTTASILPGDYRLLNLQDRAFQGRNNALEGIFIDDFVIGFAERGEIVSQAPADASYAPEARRPIGKVLEGAYQFEMRRSFEHALATYDEQYPYILTYAEGFAANDRFANGIAFTVPEPGLIAPGSFFTVDDGMSRRSFEFDLLGDPTSVAPGNVPVDISIARSAVDVAQIVGQAINSDLVLLATANVEAGTATIHLARAAAVDDENSSIVITVFRGQTRNGDQNLFRDQGQILIHNSSITNSRERGIVFDAAARDLDTNTPHPGPVRNLIDFNTARLVPSVSIANNLIANNDVGGILFSGDLGTDPQSPVPFGRIYNNTIYGGDSPTGIGIQVNQAASPTLLNNVVANLQTGISVGSTSLSTQIGSTVYHRNVRDAVGVATGALAVVVPTTEEIFVDAVNDNFYPSAGSKLIDSARDSLEDRIELTSISNPIGIPASPILSPERDLLNQQRADDGSVSNTGLGQNPFKDRGAFERADFTGPAAMLFDPLDNDPGRDLNPIANFVRLGAETPSSFAVRIFDGMPSGDPATGVGVHDVTVTGGQFRVFRDGTPLTQGVDYFFSYDSLDNVARFVPALGTWAADHTYVIELNNNPVTGIKDIAGNVLRPNDFSGATRFTIELDLLDFGDAPDPTYPTTSIDTTGEPGAYHAILSGFRLGTQVTPDGDGQPSANADADAGDDGVVFGGRFLPGEATSATVNVVRSGVAAPIATFINAWIDFNADGDWNDAGEQVFTNMEVIAGANNLSIAVPAGAKPGSTYARFRLSTEQDLLPFDGAIDGEVEDYRIEIAPLVKYELQLNYANSAKQLYRDGSGQYVVSPGLEVTAEVYVDDQRINGEGVRQAFADLIYNNDLIDWNAGSLSFGPVYSSGQSGTVDDAATPQVDEAGGVAPTSTNGDRELLFRVTGTIKDTAIADSTFTVSLDPADISPAHDTLLFSHADPVIASYESETIVVKQAAWQNALHRMDVNADGFITPIDALIIINRLNVQGSGALDATPNAPNTPQPFYDTNGDGDITPIDALVVINRLNTVGSGPIPPAGDGSSFSTQTFFASSGDTPSEAMAATNFVAESIELDSASGAMLASSFDVTPVAVSVAQSGSTAVGPALARSAEIAAAQLAAENAAFEDASDTLFDNDATGVIQKASFAVLPEDSDLWPARGEELLTASAVAVLDTLAVTDAKDEYWKTLFEDLGF